MDLNKRKIDIIKVLVGFNVIFGLLSFFYVSKWSVIVATILNLLLAGTYLIIEKYFYIFDLMLKNNKFANKLKTKLESLD